MGGSTSREAGLGVAMLHILAFVPSIPTLWPYIAKTATGSCGFGFCPRVGTPKCNVLLEVGSDEALSSGTDIGLRLRLQEDGRQLGVCTTTLVRHRFGDDFVFACHQWLPDGAGLAHTIREHPRRAGWLLALPLATVRGAGLSLVGASRYLPYGAGFLFYNSRAMFREILHGY